MSKKIKVIETFLLGREKDINLCEDGFIVTDDYAVIIDGAGTPSPMLFNGKKGGRYMMEIIYDYVSDLKDTGYLTNIEFLNGLNNFITDRYKEEGFFNELSNNINSRPMASMVVYSKSLNQLWFYGDCKALVDGIQYENPKFIDEVMLDARKMVIEGELLLGRTKESILKDDIGRDYINKLLSYQRLFLHSRDETPLAFSSIDGFDFRLEDIKVVSLRGDVSEIVMTSDGYNDLRETLLDTENILKDSLKNDPLSINELKGFKVYSDEFNSFDDRSYIRIKLM